MEFSWLDGSGHNIRIKSASGTVIGTYFHHSTGYGISTLDMNYTGIINIYDMNYIAKLLAPTHLKQGHMPRRASSPA